MTPAKPNLPKTQANPVTNRVNLTAANYTNRTVTPTTDTSIAREDRAGEEPERWDGLS